MTSPQHAKAINRAIDHITQHLGDPLSLDELAAIACLSPYHFHRIFRSEMGESPVQYLNRRRMEQGGRRLLQNPEKTVGEISYELGFNSLSVFCRNFKRHFGMNAEAFREHHSKNRQPDHKNEQHTSFMTRYFCREQIIKTGGLTMNCTFEIQDRPQIRAIYCRHKGAFNQMGGTIEKLMQWAWPRGLVKPDRMLLMSVYHDDPAITPEEKLISDICLAVDGEVKTEGEIGNITIKGGKYAVGHFEITMEEFPAAWNAMFRLVIQKGFKTTEGDYHEFYLNDPKSHPEQKHIVDICIPVVPA